MRHFLVAFGFLCIAGTVLHIALIDEPTPLRLVPLALGALSFFGAIFLYARASAIKSKEDAAQLTALVDKYPLPSAFRPFATSSVSFDELVRFERLVLEVTPLIQQGKTPYTHTQLQLSANLSRIYLRQILFIKSHPILSCIFIVLAFPMGFLPLIAYGLFLWGTFSSVSKMEEIFAAFYSGRLISERRESGLTPGSSLTAELSRLHDLLKSGALTQDEFDQEKRRILKTAG